ncbi:hypothetical protein BFP76_14475 [Amylibacter kogurei]|uniref:Glycosyl transferase n=1 Tax=Paramylibacter kogurei TaxID=1889778 RepID=A0A2G5KBZ5_9RHOB|nr:hypothetical protein [Amylibacter kogurei]PIB26154.1 hypothetical protein BFP76_14475 [Amylibacter kogurei]
MPKSEHAFSWQCFLISWGDKYADSDINRLVENISKHASSEPRFVMMTDRIRVGVDPRVQQVEFPAYFLNEKLRGPGCQAKLGMFEKGVMPDDLPAIYVDIDTIILGDLTKAFQFHDVDKTIQILQSAVLPFSEFARFIYKLTKKKRYARGNSSVVVFHPAKCHFIASEFRKRFDEFGDFHQRPMIADERFISWIAQPMVRALPKHFAVKFPTEFMLHTKFLTYLKSCLPWVVRRRQKLVAVTLCGVISKPEKLVTMQVGETLRDNKNRILIWNDRVIGELRKKLISYYQS